MPPPEPTSPHHSRRGRGLQHTVYPGPSTRIVACNTRTAHPSPAVRARDSDRGRVTGSIRGVGRKCRGLRPHLRMCPATSRLIYETTVQWRSPAVHRRPHRQAEFQTALDLSGSRHRSVVIGPRCEVGVWSDFFTHSQTPGDSVGACVSKCPNVINR